MNPSEQLARGQARFTGDLPLPADALHAMVATSPHAHARFSAIDACEALAVRGVVAVLTADDIPGINDIGHIHHDEPLLAAAHVHCVGQPFALVVASDPHAARLGAAAVSADWQELPAILDPRQARARGEMIQPPRTLACGDVDTAFNSCTTIVEGSISLGSAEHLYLETQCAFCLPRDDGGLALSSATQSPGMVQQAVARVTGLPMHRVTVDVARLGGGFGGKEDHATPWACFAALAARHLGRPVKIELTRREDMRITGKRHPYRADYRLGLDAHGNLLAWEADFLQDAGATTDISPIVLERSLLHATNAYRLPNVRVTLTSCRTNLPTNTAFRGFGAPQAVFTLEAAIRQAARRTGIPAEKLQERNLLEAADALPYGMTAHSARVRDAWRQLDSTFAPDARRREVSAWNAAHRFDKRGIDILPVCFGIGFTSAHLNQATALLHAYADGTVSVTTGAVEMGQGVHDKIRHIVALTLGIEDARVFVESTNSSRVANVSPTAASTGADLNGAAAQEACRRLIKGLREAGLPDDMPWTNRITAAHAARVPLSVLAHHAAPGLSFDRGSIRGTPFFYHVCGVALVESRIDVLRGTGRIERVSIVHDAGHSLDERIDHGQIAGALVQGIGWMTTEELRHDEAGRLLTDSLAEYRIPAFNTAPVIDIRLLPPDGDDNGSPPRSKAVGEPPLLYGLGAYFSLRDAIDAARGPEAALADTDDRAPLTAERIFRQLHPDGFDDDD